MRDEYGYQISSVRSLPPGPPLDVDRRSFSEITMDTASKLDLFIGRAALWCALLILGEAIARLLA